MLLITDKMSELFQENNDHKNNDSDNERALLENITKNNENISISSTSPSPMRICLVGQRIISDPEIVAAAKTFNKPIITCEPGDENVLDTNWLTYFILDDFNFEDTWFQEIKLKKHRILGPPALQQAAERNDGLPCNKRPLYNDKMTGFKIFFTGCRNRDELKRTIRLIEFMNGVTQKRDYDSETTHFISNVASSSKKYYYAMGIGLPVVQPSWVFSTWDNRDNTEFLANDCDVIKNHKVKPFQGRKICFFGFTQDENQHMVDVLISNGGTETNIDDPECSHVVVDEHTVQIRPEHPSSHTFIVKSDWFWYTIQKGHALETDYLFRNYLDTMDKSTSIDPRDSLPGNFNHRKRKRQNRTATDTTPRSANKRRSSVSDAGLLSISGSFLDYTGSPHVKLDSKEILNKSSEFTPKKKSMRYHYFMDLFGTESNYVGILHTIVTLFQKPLEEMADTPEYLLNKSEVRSIFNNFSPIHDVHLNMLNRFRELQSDWKENCLIGKIFLDYREALVKAYPPYVNFFEQMKECLVQCDQRNPRFHAFLKINQTKAECGRQTLQDLMIRPVQRLPSISLLITDILKHTAKSNPDYQELERALKAIKEVMTHINEDKRKTESRLALFDIFNDIDNCPPDLVSSHRSFISKCEVTELSNNLSGRDDSIMIFLFTDYMELCKIKKSRFNTVKSPTLGQYHHHNNGSLNGTRVTHHQKLFKHLKLLPLSSISCVYNIVDGLRAFALPYKDKLYAFSICDEIDKMIYLKSLCKQLAENACRADAEQFLCSYDSQDLGVDISEINVGTLKKAFTRTRLRVTRAFSFNKTPMRLKRNVSTSPSFGSTNSLTPATHLAQMKLPSCTNINEVGENGSNEEDNDDDDEENVANSTNGGNIKQNHAEILVAPMSVQPIRKNKMSTLSIAALRRI